MKKNPPDEEEPAGHLAAADDETVTRYARAPARAQALAAPDDEGDQRSPRPAPRRDRIGEMIRASVLIDAQPGRRPSGVMGWLNKTTCSRDAHP